MAVGDKKVVIHDTDDRRRHERVDDEIMMYWRVVQPDEIPEEIESDWEAKQDEPSVEVGNVTESVAECSLSSQLKLLSLETAELLKRIGRTDPVLVKYLTVLERKVDALSSAVIAQDNLALNHSTHYVNLSVSGVAFLSAEGYPIGTLLELEMVFLPTLTSVIAYGRVIYCIRYSGEKLLSHRVGVGFVRLHYYDREMLARHVGSRKLHGKETREVK